MKHRETMQSLDTLANAAELAGLICEQVVGNECSDTIQGSELTRSTVHQLAQSKFRAELAHQLGG